MEDDKENLINGESVPKDSGDERHEEATVYEYFETETGARASDNSGILLMLFELTKIDGELAEIDDERGDLPFKIEELSQKLSVIDSHLTEDKAKLKSFEAEEKVLLKENKTSEDKMIKYDDLKYKAKNNKEYDEITKSIDGLMGLIQKNEARIKELKSYQESLVKQILEFNRNVEELKADLKENRSMLNSLNKQFEDEEKELTAKRKVILDKLNNKQKSLYERINGSLKGDATAIVRRGNCSGCYNSVPPQREIEIRMAEHIFICQSCGRILIDESLLSNTK
ncbi:MAG: C4-type zinc ribbon domain-containing protein [Ignavibacteriae bacterium]|nr:C4-type zinc ribbon domain-containing protein [Ignavibacteriota bacterium]